MNMPKRLLDTAVGGRMHVRHCIGEMVWRYSPLFRLDASNQDYANIVGSYEPRNTLIFFCKQHGYKHAEAEILEILST